MHTGLQTQGSLCMLLKRVSALPRAPQQRIACRKHCSSTPNAMQGTITCGLSYGHYDRHRHFPREGVAVCAQDNADASSLWLRWTAAGEHSNQLYLIHERCCFKQQQLMQQAHCQGSCCLVLKSHWSPSSQVLQPIIIL